jgi:hypothetical protein
LAGEFGGRTEVGLSAGGDFLSINRVVNMAAWTCNIVGYLALPDIESLVSVVRLSFTLFDRLF